MSDVLLCVQPFPCPGGHMEKQEKWKLEVEIGNKNGSQKKCQLLVQYKLTKWELMKWEVDQMGIDKVNKPLHVASNVAI